MSVSISSSQVWNELHRQMFGVLGMVTSGGEARTVGIVYAIQDGKLYIGTASDAWKTRHIRAHPSVSMTVPIAKRIPFLPWIRIPAATITFQGTARIYPVSEVSSAIVARVLGGLENVPEPDAMCIIEVEPRGSFVTYGVGVSLMTMRVPEKARGRVEV